MAEKKKKGVLATFTSSFKSQGGKIGAVVGGVVGAAVFGTVVGVVTAGIGAIPAAMAGAAMGSVGGAALGDQLGKANERWSKEGKNAGAAANKNQAGVAESEETPQIAPAKKKGILEQLGLKKTEVAPRVISQGEQKELARIQFGKNITLLSQRVEQAGEKATHEDLMSFHEEGKEIKKNLEQSTLFTAERQAQHKSKITERLDQLLSGLRTRLGIEASAAPLTEEPKEKAVEPLPSAEQAFIAMIEGDFAKALQAYHAPQNTAEQFVGRIESIGDMLGSVDQFRQKEQASDEVAKSLKAKVRSVVAQDELTLSSTLTERLNTAKISVQESAAIRKMISGFNQEELVRLNKKETTTADFVESLRQWQGLEQEMIVDNQKLLPSEKQALMQELKSTLEANERAWLPELKETFAAAKAAVQSKFLDSSVVPESIKILAIQKQLDQRIDAFVKQLEILGKNSDVSQEKFNPMVQENKAIKGEIITKINNPVVQNLYLSKMTDAEKKLSEPAQKMWKDEKIKVASTKPSTAKNQGKSQEKSYEEANFSDSSKMENSQERNHRPEAEPGLQGSKSPITKTSSLVNVKESLSQSDSQAPPKLLRSKSMTNVSSNSQKIFNATQTAKAQLENTPEAKEADHPQGSAPGLTAGGDGT